MTTCHPATLCDNAEYWKTRHDDLVTTLKTVHADAKRGVSPQAWVIYDLPLLLTEKVVTVP